MLCTFRQNSIFSPTIWRLFFPPLFRTVAICEITRVKEVKSWLIMSNPLHAELISGQPTLPHVASQDLSAPASGAPWRLWVNHGLTMAYPWNLTSVTWDITPTVTSWWNAKSTSETISYFLLSQKARKEAALKSAFLSKLLETIHLKIQTILPWVLDSGRSFLPCFRFDGWRVLNGVTPMGPCPERG